MRRADVDGVAVQIHEPALPPGISATPVLLLHGIGGNADTFAGVAPRLAAAGWRTIVWSAPGYGDSADPGPEVTESDSPGAYVSVVANLLETLDARPAHVAGVSWGGVIAIHLAFRRPEMVASLTLVDSTRGSATTPERAEAMRARVAELTELGGRAFAAARAPRLLASETPEAVAAEVRDQMGRVRLAGFAGAAEMMAQSDTGPLLPTLRVPALVLVGDQDRVTGVEESRLLAGEIPGARFGLIPEAGHAAIQERPDLVAEAFLDFLSRFPHPSEVAP